MHYNPSVNEAFSSIEHINCLLTLLAILFILLIIKVFKVNIKMGLYRFSKNLAFFEPVSSVHISKIGLKLKEIKPNSSEKEYSSFLKWFVGFSDASQKSVVVFGKNLTSTVGMRFSRTELAMVELAPYQHSVIIGLLLSDGWLTFASKTTKNARLGFQQSLYKSAYTLFVFSLLSHYCSTSPKLRSAIRVGSRNYSLQFFTRSMPCLTKLHSLFYPNGIKIIPLNIYELLTPVALAHLIMGDGYYLSKGIAICTDSYTIKDTINLLNALIIRYGLNCTLHNIRANQYRIYISRKSIENLIIIVKPHMIPSMYYKIGL